MNVIVVNENKNIIDRLDIDVIKRIDGQYELNDLLGKFVNLYYNKMIIDITSIANYENIDIIRELAKRVDTSRMILLLNSSPIVNDPGFLSELVKAGVYNFTRNVEGIKYLYNTSNSYEDVQHFVLSGEYISPIADTNNQVNVKRIIVGVQNLTEHAGASTLVNLMVKTLNQAGLKAKGIEISRQDLMFYHDDNLKSCMTKIDIESTLAKFADQNAVIIDLNSYSESNKYCDEIIYLLEPSYIKMTKMLKKNRNILASMKLEDKIVLNMSFMNKQDVPNFESETRVKIFDNLPPINDRDINQPEILNLLIKLGFEINN